MNRLRLRIASLASLYDYLAVGVPEQSDDPDPALRALLDGLSSALGRSATSLQPVDLASSTGLHAAYSVFLALLGDACVAHDGAPANAFVRVNAAGSVWFVRRDTPQKKFDDGGRCRKFSSRNTETSKRPRS